MFDDEFYPPPEAPVFEPNEEEFSDPLGYIAKIRPIAERAGICKVRPPPYWQPPFAIDVENFKFTPRIQRLNELGIQTRIRLQFIQRVAKFWELQGTTFKIPHITGRPLDLYGLHQFVKRMGGFEEVCKNRQWNTVCMKLGLAKNFSTNLRQHYEKLLYSYDILMSGALIETLDGPGKPFTMNLSGRNVTGKPKIEKTDGLDGDGNSKYRSKRKAIEESLHVDVSNNKELAKLQLFGAGPKMMGLGLIAKRKNRLKSQEKICTIKSEQSENPLDKNEEPKGISDSLLKSEAGEDCKNIFDLMNLEEELETKSLQVKSEVEKNKASTADDKGKKMITRKKGSEQIPYSIIDSIDNCKICSKDNNDSQLLLCDGCDDSYHTYCLIPPLQNVPKGDWRCPKCLSKACNQKMDAYGFEQARKQYTLQSFGEMADAFKSEYFTKPVHMIPTEVVEREFWRLIGSLEEDVAVEYGADIHVLDHGSGFPRMCDKEKRPMSVEEEEYANSGWNLNNLPVTKQSLLSCMTSDISGMKVPWVYVGMCFSAFCWHIEDHWTYSINYLHWGEPKTWYGVPREDATKLEEVMHNTAPELFKQHPDVLHHLVTTTNPANLMNSGVRVVRTNQCAGEFVITFPRAYHAGFNQGYNFAEAVNFCPADWIPIGRQCVAHYRTVKRPCVFSHEEIMCKVANNPECLNVRLAASVYRDMLIMFQEEQVLRKKMQDLGIENMEREAFELVPDDERQCHSCKTTCFLSALACPCQLERLVCLHHMEDLCSTCTPNKLILRYRYTLEELLPMVHKVKTRAESFDNWSHKVENALVRTNDKLTLPELKELLEEAIKGGFPECEILHQLHSAVKEAEKCSSVAHQLVTVRKHRTRLKDVNASTLSMKYSVGCMLTLDEIRAFYQQLIGLPCTVPNLEQVSEYIENIEDFVSHAEAILEEEEPSSKAVAKLIDDSIDFDVELAQIPRLHHALQQAKWLEEVRSCLLLDDENAIDDEHAIVSLEQLRKLIDAGVSVAPRPAVERAMAELQELLNLSEAWEERAKKFIASKEKGSMKVAEMITSEAKNVPVYLPNCVQLQAVVTKANNWITKLETIQKQDYYPYLDVLEALLLQAKSLEVKLAQMPIVDTQVAAAQEWKERTSRVFLKKNTIFSLFDVLSPRTKDKSMPTSLKAMRRKIRETESEHQVMIEKRAKNDNFDIHNPVDPAEVVSDFKMMQEQEIAFMKELREIHNMKSGCSSSPEDGEKKNTEKMTDSQPYCVCMKPSSGFMLQCELCHDWFHTSCVPVLKFNSTKSKVQQVYELKFLCPLCHRSRRPRLEIILSLLLQLQKLPVRIKEGEALQCLTERGMAWQDRARDVLKSPEYAKIVEQLNKKMRENEKLWQEQEMRRLHITSTKEDASLENVDTAPAATVSRRMSSMDLIDDTIDTILRRSTVQEDQPDSSGVDALLSAASKTDTEQEDVMEAAEVLAMIACAPSKLQASPVHNAASGDQRNEETASEPAMQQIPMLEEPIDEKKEDLPENGRSSPSELGFSNPSSNNSKHAESGNKTDIKNTAMDEECGPVESTFLSKGALIDLPEQMKQTLEELMMEGDLLEVTLDETQQIWKILQASQPLNDDKFHELQEIEDTKGSKTVLDREVERKRKKKEDTHVICTSEKKKKKHRNSGEIGGGSGRESKKNEKKRRKRGDNKQSALDALVAFEEDEYAFCAVSEATRGTKLCKQPTGEEVDWLQCDGGCEGWFHCVCVSITAEEARELDYVCEMCAATKTTDTSERLDDIKPDLPMPLERQNSDGSSVMEVDVTITPSLSPTNNGATTCVT